MGQFETGIEPEPDRKEFSRLCFCIQLHTFGLKFLLLVCYILVLVNVCRILTMVY
jgi:hypothetical protein